MLSLTWWLVQRFGLPDWVLLVAGAPAAGRAPDHAPGRATGAAPDHGAHGGRRPARADRLAGRLLSWRGAIAGGGIAFGGLAAGTALFMGLRVLGVGPFATLVSAGVLSDRAAMIVADFVNRTSDSTLAASITEAFRIDLSQSPSVRLVERTSVANTLKLMERNPDDAADRAGGARGGDPLRCQGRSHGRDRAAGVGLRPLGAAGERGGRRHPAGGERSGERRDRPSSRRSSGSPRNCARASASRCASIRAEAPLAQVTTSSLEALRTYTRGARAADGGNNTEAIRLLRQAVALDSGFAMAWRKLGVALGNAGEDREGSLAALTRAVELKDRLPPREAALAAAYYAASARRDYCRGDQDLRTGAGHLARRRHPLTNLGLLYAAALTVRRCRAPIQPPDRVGVPGRDHPVGRDPGAGLAWELRGGGEHHGRLEPARTGITRGAVYREPARCSPGTVRPGARGGRFPHGRR